MVLLEVKNEHRTGMGGSASQEDESASNKDRLSMQRIHTEGAYHARLGVCPDFVEWEAQVLCRARQRHRALGAWAVS